MKLGEAMYNASQSGGAEGDSQQSAGEAGDDVVDVDFEEVKDDDSKKSA
jgi:molecular chaperone DnaK